MAIEKELITVPLGETEAVPPFPEEDIEIEM